MTFTDVLAVVAVLFFGLCYMIGQGRHLSRLRRYNQPHSLTPEDFQLNGHFVKEHQMPEKLIQLSKNVLIAGFQTMNNLGHIEEYVESKLEEQEGGQWLCLIHVRSKVFRLDQRAPRELYLTLEKDGLKVIVAQTKP